MTPRKPLFEKKYIVDSFADIHKIIAIKKLPLLKESVTKHFYGHHNGNDVEKVVFSDGTYKIRSLKEKNGTFEFTKNTEVENLEEGLAWLKKRGYSFAELVDMQAVEYGYKTGTIGLYTIDGFLLSVILYYPEGAHEAVEKEFGLDAVKVLSVPYNVYLSKLGKLRSMKLK